jgi:hypothetical protein
MACLVRPALSTLFLLASVSPPSAHSWYPIECCSERDCHELDETHGETVTETSSGWLLWDGRIVARQKARPSPDRKFHLCETRSRGILCFFAPQGES